MAKAKQGQARKQATAGGAELSQTAVVYAVLLKHRRMPGRIIGKATLSYLRVDLLKTDPAIFLGSLHNRTYFNTEV